MFPRLTGSENNILIIIFIVFHLHIISLAHVYFAIKQCVLKSVTVANIHTLCYFKIHHLVWKW